MAPSIRIQRGTDFYNFTTIYGIFNGTTKSKTEWYHVRIKHFITIIIIINGLLILVKHYKHFTLYYSIFNYTM